ncbi:uncharacterized protein LOC133204431 [Saccostrea echinata]|uniref:uncharacterized protein LOC133204431 n=1 Tax=Saccostrea echinata TaxID=191078 RepID=UPI002A7EDA25|nr:uncharacterized protein LOC133204431 [Saccostrea echinata]
MYAEYCILMVLSLLQGGVSTVMDCKISVEGLEYRGNISFTVSGKTCQRWDSQTPHSHDYANRLPGNVSRHENYCRNPRPGIEPIPWCYTMDQVTRWEHCDIPFCVVDCRKTREGMEYRGNISITISGKTCQRWDRQKPWTHSYTNILPGNASMHENFCRNPQAKEADGPWCYTTDTTTRWEYCDIPFCECRDTIKGEEYRGTISHTTTGRECLRWDSQHSPEPSFALFPEGNSSSHENYCRNPAEQDEKPWCFTDPSEKYAEYCNIPLCSQSNKECLDSAKGQHYFGTKAETKDGIACQRWDKLQPHEHKFSLGFLGLSASEHENYCRNPDNGVKPWCYTLNDTVRYQYCDIPLCEKSEDCKETEGGMGYQGKRNITQSGIACQRWDSTYPHVPNNRISFPGSTLSRQENYCRNPDGEQAPWCYTMDPNVRWQFCDIPFCINSSFQCDFSGEMCGLEQPNDTGMTWFLNKDERSLRFRPPKNVPNSQLYISTLKSPLLRSMKMGNCLILAYRSEGIELQLTTSTQNLTKLKESSEFRRVKVNINPQPDNYKVFIAPHIAASLVAESSTVAAIKFMEVQNGPCTGKDCFSCLDDRLCISHGFCDMTPDCPDYSDEENCALECYHENEYKGFRKETKYLHQCMAELGNTCSFDLSGKREPGCFVDSEFKWEECSVPTCDKGNFICDFEQDMCDWQQMLSGTKWNRQIDENTGEMFASAEKKESLRGNTEEKAVLYSTPQPSSSEFGCLTMTYSGENVNLNVFITQGTVLTLDGMIFQRQNINSDLFATTSFQTPIDIPYLVSIVATFQANVTGIVRLGKISYEKGICKDKDPCYKTEYQCDDGRCVDADQFCNKKNDCPNNEDENVCNYTSSKCVQMEKGCVLPCPYQCECKGVVFKCQSPENVIKEVRVLDLSSSNFDTKDLRDFSFLLHLNLSGCSKEDSSLRDLGKQLQSHSLQTLDISFNRIRNLQQSTFEKLSNILYLNVSHNQITDLQFDFLGVIPKLRHLILRNNKIVIIHSKEIYSRYNSSLQLLDLRNNKIKTILPKALHWLSFLSKLLLSNNSITNTDDYFSRSMKMLVEVDMSFNSISIITDNMFSGLRRLGYLNLQHNQIQVLNDFSFSTLTSLQTLNLAFNKIHTINRMAFENMVSLTKLNLTGNQLRKLSPARFVALVKLQILDLSDNDITILESNAFRRLEEVKYLYINRNKLSVSRTMFQGLCNLEWIWTDSYIICCAKPLSVDPSKCISPRDRISTCEQLISVGFLAQVIWYVALFSLIGNLYVIYYRMRSTNNGRNNAHGILVLNLSFSDLLMGVYLFIIAVADMKYRNNYGFNDSQWRSSNICTVAGLLATVSSEASVIFVFLITLERLLALKYPFSTEFLRKRKHKFVISVMVWLMTILLAAFPISVYPDFYSRSTVCISLPLTAEKVAGWEYATFVFIGLNLIIFIAIVIGQILIFVEVKVIGGALQQDNRKREIAVLKSLSYVVLSDMCCWIPIILIGIMAYGGMDISFDVYAWVVVLVLPLNSALNPFIYTFIVIYRQKQESQRGQNISMDERQNGRQLSRNSTTVSGKKDHSI